MLESGILLVSNDWNLGPEFVQGSPGVYCTPLLKTARRYARPHILCGGGVYHRLIFELRTDPNQLLRARKKGGEQRMSPSTAVSLHAVWVERNAPSGHWR